MGGKEIVDIIIAVGVFGWIPIYFLFNGIAKVVNAIKRNTNEENSHAKVDILKEEDKNKIMCM